MNSLNRVYEIVRKIGVELKSNEYNLPNDVLDRIDFKCKNIQFNIIPTSQKIITNLFSVYDEQFEIEYKSKNNGNSHILDYPPIYHMGRFYYVIPIVNLAENTEDDEFVFSIYHEVAHLFSTSEWTYDSNEHSMIRYSGVSKEIYYYIGEDVVNASNTSVWWQEFINDWVAEHLYSIMAKKKYSGSNVGKNTQMSSFLLGVINREFNGDVKKFIGSYFSNQLCHLEMEYTDKERE